MPAALADIRRLVAAEHGLAVVSVARPDGTVHASVVNAGVLDDAPGGGSVIAFVARGAARKLTLLRRARQATVTFRTGWQWAGVEGPPRLIGPDDPDPDPDAGVGPDALPALLRDVFRCAGGTHEDWNAFDRAMAEERRTAVLVTPQRILGNR